MNWCDILVVCTMHAWCCCIVKDNREIAANALLIVVAVTATAAKPTQAEWERQRALRLDWYSSKRGSLTLWWLTFFRTEMLFFTVVVVYRALFLWLWKISVFPWRKKTAESVTCFSFYGRTVVLRPFIQDMSINLIAWIFNIFVQFLLFPLIEFNLFDNIFLSASRTMETWLNMHQWHFEMFDYFASWNVRVSVLYHKYYKTQMLHYSDFVWKSNCESCSRAAMSI